MWNISFFPPELLLHNYKCGGYVPCCVTVNTHTIVNWKNSTKYYWRLWHITNVNVIWRLPVWNVKIRRHLASCTLQFWSNLTKLRFQGKHFNYFVHCCKYDMYDFTFSRWQILPAEPLSIIARRFIRVEWNIQIKKIIYKKFWKSIQKCIINSITKSYILNIKIRPLVTEYALMIKLVDGTSNT